MARTVEVESTDTCKCGTNEHLVVTGISCIYEIAGKLAWAVRCFQCSRVYYIDDEARDKLFGTGWRKEGSGQGQVLDE